MAKLMTMDELAELVAVEVYDGDPQADLVTREIADADDKDEAVRRLETLADEVARALEIVRASKAVEHTCTDVCRSYGCPTGAGRR